MSAEDYMRRLARTDPALHRELSSKGGRRTAEKRRRGSLQEAHVEDVLTEERVATERARMDEEANMHICPID